MPDGFASHMAHRHEVVTAQVTTGLLSVKHLCCLINKAVKCAPADYRKATKNLKPPEGDVMTKFDMARGATQGLLEEYFRQDKKFYDDLGSQVGAPLAQSLKKFEQDQKQSSVQFKKLEKTFDKTKSSLAKKETDCRNDLQGLESLLRETKAGASDKQRKTLAKRREHAAKNFTKYASLVNQANTDQSALRKGAPAYLASLESIERFRLKTMEVYIRKIASLCDQQIAQMQTIVRSLDGVLDTMDIERQVNHAIAVWAHTNGPVTEAVPFTSQLPCGAEHIKDPDRQDFQVYPNPASVEASASTYVPTGPSPLYKDIPQTSSHAHAKVAKQMSRKASVTSLSSAPAPGGDGEASSSSSSSSSPSLSASSSSSSPASPSCPPSSSSSSSPPSSSAPPPSSVSKAAAPSAQFNLTVAAATTKSASKRSPPPAAIHASSSSSSSSTTATPTSPRMNGLQIQEMLNKRYHTAEAASMGGSATGNVESIKAAIAAAFKEAGGGEETESVRTPMIGLIVRDRRKAKHVGVKVSEITGRPAREAGFKKGDVIRGMFGMAIDRQEELMAIFLTVRYMEPLHFLVERRGTLHSFTVVVGCREDDDPNWDPVAGVSKIPAKNTLFGKKEAETMKVKNSKTQQEQTALGHPSPPAPSTPTMPLPPQPQQTRALPPPQSSTQPSRTPAHRPPPPERQRTAPPPNVQLSPTHRPPPSARTPPLARGHSTVGSSSLPSSVAADKPVLLSAHLAAGDGPDPPGGPAGGTRRPPPAARRPPPPRR